MAIRGIEFMTNFNIACLRQVYKEFFGLLLLLVLEAVLLNLTFKYVSIELLKIVLIFLGVSNIALTLEYWIVMVVFILKPNFAVNSQIIKSIYDFDSKYRNAKSASNP